MTHATFVVPRKALEQELRQTWSFRFTVGVAILIAVAIGIGLIWAFATGLIDLSPVVIAQIGNAKAGAEHVRIGVGWMDPVAMRHFVAGMFRIPL